nr:O-antigen ligase family protein [Planosporangium thailandense]
MAGLGARGPRFVLYYDAVTPSLAAAILLAVFLRQHWGRLEIGLGLAAGVVLLLSPRRTPVFALLITGLLLIVLTRRKRVLRRSVVSGGIMAICVVFSSALPDNLRIRLKGGIAVLTGASHEDSAAGHFGDLHRGYELGITGPLFGLGPDSPQPSGLAASDAHALYVHDEFLHVWVGRGILAALALCVLVLMSTIHAMRATSKVSPSQASLTETTAVCFLLQMPIILTFFPYLSTTTRWPLVYGIALAVAARTRRMFLPRRRAETTDEAQRPEIMTSVPHGIRLVTKESPQQIV